LPKDKQIEFIMVSAGSGTVKSLEGTKALAMSMGCEVVGYLVVSAKINKATGDISTKEKFIPVLNILDNIYCIM